MSIGSNIKKIRKERGYTQVELSGRANLSRSYLADVERDRYNPSVETLTSIAKALGVSSSFILGATDDDMECKRLYEELKVILRMMSHNGQFNSDTKNAIQQEATHLYKKISLDFEHTPSNILEICEEHYDKEFIQEFINVLEKAKESLEGNKSSLSKDTHHDFKEILEDDETEIKFNGVPLDKEEKIKILRVMEAMFWNDKKNN
ncbi:helix-turn-helix domain-containing protein [Chengkuizengella axinellae]|uniref:Helix-turn-helix transcriptional regulator n=1 Tax=Chengkuizengella axinellae TaxID=3064388 RepID=A0ABT9IYW6_9BACL|nr:helix-turn-helix transcriptional regulator [Chengkuizengella sp. 2205SS18-9]MDP5273990.1 helix-turn-helix transcriptional regulator [Chengkuizengella sp. 2205SS18-9]